MARVRTTLVFVVLAVLATAAAPQTAHKSKPAQTPAKHAVVTSGDLKWGPAPPALPAGGACDVRGNDDVGQAIQRVPARQHFRVRHVQDEL